MGTTDLTKRVEELKGLEAHAKEVANAIDAIKGELKQELQTRGVEELPAGNYTIRYKEVETKRFDTKRFQAERAKLYAKYLTVSKSMRFTCQ